LAGFKMPDETVIGEVALRVADLERSVRFYTGPFGLGLFDRREGLAVLGADGRPLLRLTERPDARPKPHSATGLYHFAVLLPDRAALGRLFLNLVKYGVPIEGAADHLVSEAIYLRDPDGNGIEIYRDKPRQEWPMAGPEVRMANAPLDFEGIVAAAGDRPWEGIAPGTRIGHVHLQVSDLGQAERFYCQILGFTVMQRWRGALFVSAGGYHHHIGLNVWASLGGPPAPEDSAGLEYFGVVVPFAGDLRALAAALAQEGVEFSEVQTDDGRPAIRTYDPDRIGLLISAQAA
jgi:catechol 2,3-dioxygenase